MTKGEIGLFDDLEFDESKIIAASALPTPCLPRVDGGYRVVVADPAWRYDNAGITGAAENHYQTMSDDDIAALPVRDIVADDAVLFLWATWPRLVLAMRVIVEWGFEYVTGFPWIKIQGAPSTDLWGALSIKPHYGIGFWVRGCSEPLLIARRGKASPPDVDGGPYVGLLSEAFRHSRKPENLYHVAEWLPAPRLEMFARRRRDGWDAWGLEAGSNTNRQTDGEVE